MRTKEVQLKYRGLVERGFGKLGMRNVWVQYVCAREESVEYKVVAHVARRCVWGVFTETKGEGGEAVTSARFTMYKKPKQGKGFVIWQTPLYKGGTIERFSKGVGETVALAQIEFKRLAELPLSHWK